MIDADYEFTDPHDPLKSEWSETYYISNFSNDMFVDFVGIKVGDVNASAIHNLQAVSSEVRSNKT